MKGVNVRSMRVLTLTCVMGYALLACAGVARPQRAFSIKRLTSQTDKRRDEGLDRIISQVKSSFVQRDTEQLTRCLGKRKVYISLKSRTSETGYYTKSQVQFIFDKLFREVKTRSFDYSPRDITISDDAHAYFRSEWTYVVLGSDSVVTEHLHLSFVKEKDGWSISEIKSSAR